MFLEKAKWNNELNQKFYFNQKKVVILIQNLFTVI